LTAEGFVAGLEKAGFYGVEVLKKSPWKEIDGYPFFSMTVRGYKFEKTAGCVFRGQRAVYLGPGKALVDEEGHTFPRNVEIDVCTDTAAKLSRAPYAGSFHVFETGAGTSFEGGPDGRSGVSCDPATGCC
jgi:hypothetical protein